MKCQKCGASLPKESMYCETCGNEYKIVPDFEPEIENHIAKTMLGVGDDIEAEGKESPKTSFLPALGQFIMKKQKIYEMTHLVVYGTICCILLLMIGVYLYRDSYRYLEKEAVKAEERMDYSEAILYYHKLRKKEPGNSVWYVKEAFLELNYGDREAAVQIGYQCLDKAGENKEIIDMLFSLLKEEKKYEEMYHVLQRCTDETLLEEYKEYNSLVGKLSHEGGSYTSIIKITIEEGSPYIFYTLDGSTPDKSSTPYQGEIVLGRGTHTLSLIAYNNYGIGGKILRKEYNIDTSVPVAPVVFPQEEVWDKAVQIEVQVEPKTKVYYTVDGSLPTSDSIPYEKPIPMPLEDTCFTFVAVDEEGVYGEYTVKNYTLTLPSSLSIEEAKHLLMEKLIVYGHILDQNGAIKDRYGVFDYVYLFPLELGGENYYLFEEHYLENLINNPLDKYYAVHLTDQSVIAVKRDYLGNFNKAVFE